MNVTVSVNPQQQPSGSEWEFQGTTGDCETGKFVTDNALPMLTTRIMISGTNKAGSNLASAIMGKGLGNFIVFGKSGKATEFSISNVAPADEDPTCLWLDLLTPTGDSAAWEGTYRVDFDPGT